MLVCWLLVVRFGGLISGGCIEEEKEGRDTTEQQIKREREKIIPTYHHQHTYAAWLRVYVPHLLLLDVQVCEVLVLQVQGSQDQVR